MRPIFIFIVTVVFGVSSQAQTASTDELEPYDYDTNLKGGYSISFKVDDSVQYLYLKKGNKTITQLAATSRGMLYKNLGYVGADFTDYFVLVHSFGGGNPHYIELIKKSTGQNLFRNAPAWIDADEKQEYLLYCDNDVPDNKDKMTLLNIRTGQKQFFRFPSDIFDGPQVLNRIELRGLTGKQLVIKYETEKGPKIRVYNR